MGAGGMVVEPVESLEVIPPPEDVDPALQQVGVLLRPKDPAVRDVGEAGLYPPFKVFCDLSRWKTALYRFRFSGQVDGLNIRPPFG